MSSKQIFSGDFKSSLYYLFTNIERLGYNCGIYGWNYDVYKINDFYFVEGYRYPNIENYIHYTELKKLNERFRKQQETLYNRFFVDKKIKNDYTYRRLYENLIEKQKQYFLKKLPKISYKKGV